MRRAVPPSLPAASRASTHASPAVGCGLLSGRAVAAAALALLLSACTGGSTDGAANNDLIDEDNDGYFANSEDLTARDCNDANPNVNPGSAEVCDRVDNDCNGLIDDNAQGALEWFPDLDGDGFGVRADTPLIACTRPPNTSTNRFDCNDGDAQVYPEAPERCNGLDDDCDTQIDDGLDLAAEWFADRDGDGYGGGERVAEGCSLDPTWVRNNEDCNDAVRAIRPGADEVCDGVDNDCDRRIDDIDTDVVNARRYFEDADRDGYGNILAFTRRCTAPAGFVTNALDCDDDDPLRSTESSWWRDADEDGAGDPDTPWPTSQCWQPIGYIDNEDDCDDDDPDRIGLLDLFPDADGDGFGANILVAQACQPAPGQTADNTDCDDRDATVSPGAPEVCDGVDNDCDRLVDIEDFGVTGTTRFFLDNDGDGYGRPDVSRLACTQPAGFVANSDDCNDDLAVLNPNTVWHRDADRDGFGDPLSAGITSCVVVAGRAPNDADCDDADKDYNPNTAWFLDVDLDGQGNANPPALTGCIPSTVGYATSGGDCDDNDPSVVGELCFGPGIALVELTSTPDNDNFSIVGLNCQGVSRDPITISFAQTSGGPFTAEAELPQGRVCRLRIQTLQDISGNGGATATLSVCGQPYATLVGASGSPAVIDFSAFLPPLPRCSGCMDPTAVNYDPDVLVDNGSCFY